MKITTWNVENLFILMDKYSEKTYLKYQIMNGKVFQQVLYTKIKI